LDVFGGVGQVVAPDAVETDIDPLKAALKLA